MPDLHVVYVNYLSERELRDSLATVLAHRGALELEVTVVDNSCDLAEHERLAAWMPGGVRSIRSEANVGFARACNLGAIGGRAPYLLFLNPDTLMPPGTLERIHAELVRRAGRALVGPRHYAEEQLRYAHAPFRGARLFDEAWDQLWARGWRPGRSLVYLRRRARLATTDLPVRVRSISGGCLGVGRSVFEELGGWDETYWLYGEDLEFCVRARRRGVPALLLPDAGVVHYMERSARQLAERVQASRVEGRSRFKRAHYGRWLRRCERLVERASARWPRRGDPWAGVNGWDGSPLRAPEGCSRWVVEIARSPLFDNCLTVFPSQRIEQPPPEMIRGLPAGQYFLRVAGELVPNRWVQHSVRAFTIPGSETSPRDDALAALPLASPSDQLASSVWAWLSDVHSQSLHLVPAPNSDRDPSGFA